MPFDYKKEYKEFYMPKNRPGFVEVPAMNYIAVRGKGADHREKLKILLVRIVDPLHTLLPPESLQRRNHIIKIPLDLMTALLAHLDRKGDLLRWRFGHIMRGCACSVCTSDLTIMSRRLSDGCMILWKNRRRNIKVQCVLSCVRELVYPKITRGLPDRFHILRPNKLKEAFHGTGYEHMIAQIFAYADENQDAAPRQLYTGSLHLFGRRVTITICVSPLWLSTPHSDAI